MSWNYYKLYYDLLAHSLNPVQILTVSDLSFHFLSFGYLFNWSSRQERLLKSEPKKKKADVIAEVTPAGPDIEGNKQKKATGNWLYAYINTG